jgi:uncharacterized protein (TIGR02246 family)
MKKTGFLAVILITLPSLCFCQPEDQILKIKAEIQNVLERQKEAWNSKNLEGFLAYYWNSEKLTFQSGNSRLHGWNELLARYKKSYSGENWGALDFTDLEINVFSKDSAYVLGRWKVTVKDSSKEGVFTIILQRMSNGWRIIHDHTS